MYRHLLAAVAALLLIAGSSTSLEAQVIRAESVTLAPNTSGQFFPIFADFSGGGDPIDGVLLDVFIAKGGNLGDPEGRTGPRVEAIDLQPTDAAYGFGNGVLNGFSTGHNVAQLESQFVEADILRGANDAAIADAFENQLLAVLTIDTTNISSGTFAVDLENQNFGVASTFNGGQGGAIPTTLVSGSIAITVPEPSALGMLFLTTAGTIAFRRRRR